LRSGTAHVAFGSSDSLGPCDFKDFVAQSHTPDDHCVRFAVVVTFPDATLVTKRALPLTWAGLAPAGSRQLRLAHRYSFTVADFHLLLLAGLPGAPKVLISNFCTRQLQSGLRSFINARAGGEIAPESTKKVG
jgi:hypothetical protein